MSLTLLPQLKLVDDAKGGAAPRRGHKFKRLTTFEEKYRAYQWTQGFDLKPSPISNADFMKLVCCDNTCTFQVTARVLPDAPGFHVLASPFQPKHHHPAPYKPLSLNDENTRRSVELAPSSHAPPLVPTHPLLPFLYAVDPGLLAHVTTLEALGLMLQPEELHHIEDEDLLQLFAGKGVEKDVAAQVDQIDNAAKLALRLVFARARGKKGGTDAWDVEEKQMEGFARWATEVLQRKTEA